MIISNHQTEIITISQLKDKEMNIKELYSKEKKISNKLT